MYDLIVTGNEFNDYVIGGGDHPAGLGGHQLVFRFPNDFGASVVKTPFSYGSDDDKMELAVLYFAGEGDDYELTYDTPITNDVLGHLGPDECIDTLRQIMALPPGRPEPREDHHYDSDIGELFDSVATIFSGGLW